MKKLCLFLSIVVLPALGFGQIIGDSVIVYVDNRVEINVAIPDYSQLKSSEKVSAALDAFKEMLPAMSLRLSAESADLVKYSVGGGFTLEPGDPKIIYLLKDGKISDSGFRDRAIIQGEDFKIFITTADLTNIYDMSLSTCIQKVVTILPEKESWSKSLYYECIDENVKLLEEKNNEFDMLSLSMGAGASLVRSTWVPDLSFKIGLGFNHKGLLRGPYISSNLVFDFTTENKINLNTFLNLGYQWTLDKKADKHDLLGVELGYLIAKQGDLFGENTFKLGFNWSPVKHVFVNPHLYISDNFDSVFPGIRVGFGL